MAGYVGDAVTVRYDPRDLSEIRLFYHNEFLCRAVSEEHAGEAVTLKDIQAARRLHRRSLRTTINERVARVVDFLPVQQEKPQAEERKPMHGASRKKLRIYQEDDR
jgi:putative transposase